jgi:hypothetical protein
MENIQEILDALETNTVTDFSATDPNEEFKVIYDALQKIHLSKMKHKNIHDLNTFQCVDNEIYLSGKDESGKDTTVVFNAIELLTWLDIDYIKKQIIKFIQQI